jgi:hypothetical protein
MLHKLQVIYKSQKEEREELLKVMWVFSFHDYHPEVEILLKLFAGS